MCLNTPRFQTSTSMSAQMATNAFAMQHDAGRENDNCIGLKLAKNIKSCMIGPDIFLKYFFFFLYSCLSQG